MSALTAPGLQLRRMQLDDVPRIMDVEVRAYPYPWTEGIFRDCLRVGYSCWVLESLEAELCGYAVMSIAVGECHLLNISVSPDYQGQGYGRYLLRCLLDVARERAVEMLFLEVRPSNTPALSLYHSEGFNEIGIRKRYYPDAKGREDALVMALNL